MQFFAETKSTTFEESWAFAQNIFPTLNTQREEGKLCDITLTAGEVRVYAHRAILATCSSFFHTMFTSAFAEKKQDCIDLTENFEDPNVLTTVIDFVYTQKITVTESNYLDLLNAACYLMLEDLKKFLENFSLKNLGPKNAIHMLSLADTYNMPAFLEICWEFVSCRFHDLLIYQKETYNVSAPVLQKMIGDGCLKFLTPKQYVEFLLEWIDLKESRLDEGVCFLVEAIEKMSLKRYEVRKLSETFMQLLEKFPSLKKMLNKLCENDRPNGWKSRFEKKAKQSKKQPEENANPVQERPEKSLVKTTEEARHDENGFDSMTNTDHSCSGEINGNMEFEKESENGKKAKGDFYYKKKPKCAEAADALKAQQNQNSSTLQRVILCMMKYDPESQESLMYMYEIERNRWVQLPSLHLPAEDNYIHDAVKPVLFDGKQLLITDGRVLQLISILKKNKTTLDQIPEPFPTKNGRYFVRKPKYITFEKKLVVCCICGGLSEMTLTEDEEIINRVRFIVKVFGRKGWQEVFSYDFNLVRPSLFNLVRPLSGYELFSLEKIQGNGYVAIAFSLSNNTVGSFFFKISRPDERGKIKVSSLPHPPLLERGEPLRLGVFFDTVSGFPSNGNFVITYYLLGNMVRCEYDTNSGKWRKETLLAVEYEPRDEKFFMFPEVPKLTTETAMELRKPTTEWSSKAQFGEVQLFGREGQKSYDVETCKPLFSSFNCYDAAMVATEELTPPPFVLGIEHIRWLFCSIPRYIQTLPSKEAIFKYEYDFDGTFVNGVPSTGPFMEWIKSKPQYHFSSCGKTD